jgi:hypothetical protein
MAQHFWLKHALVGDRGWGSAASTPRLLFGTSSTMGAEAGERRVKNGRYCSRESGQAARCPPS